MYIRKILCYQYLSLVKFISSSSYKYLKFIKYLFRNDVRNRKILNVKFNRSGRYLNRLKKFKKKIAMKKLVIFLTNKLANNYSTMASNYRKTLKFSRKDVFCNDPSVYENSEYCTFSE